MKIYNYNPDNGYFTNESVADESPLEPGVFLLPAHSTTVEPPATEENQVACFDGNSWSLVGVITPEPSTEPSEEELAERAAAKAAVLAQLGITEEQARLLFS